MHTLSKQVAFNPVVLTPAKAAEKKSGGKKRP